ncbi:MAG: S1 RNA-binding domain-containing protein [Anaerolineae bacterium]|nr:S1 RNA-binding domain-containing protein [Anaerolineae bacterium]
MVENAPAVLDELKPGANVSGTIHKLTLYGALVSIGLEQDALLHISQMGNADFRNIEDVLKEGEALDAYVLKVDKKTARVALTMIKPPSLPWDAIRSNAVYEGEVIRIEKYGAFIDIGAERPGMVHVSEMTDGYVQSPEDVVKVGDKVQVRVIKTNRKQRKIDLSMKTPREEIVEVMEPTEAVPTAMELALRRARAMSESRDSARAAAMKASRAPVRNNRNDDEQDDIMNRTLRSHNK